MKTKQPNPWAALDAVMKTDPEPTGPDWFTVEEFTLRYGGSTSNNHKKLLKDKRFTHWKGISARSRRTVTKFKLL